jgi:DNA (cytosine-5)-methyltransferase 1
MPQHPIPILSFFSGAGGLDYGFSRESFRVILACDNFPPAVASYNFNAKRRIARQIDLSAVGSGELSAAIDELSPDTPPEGIVGGPPCQGFSRANVQANPNDPRNLLPFRYAKILAALNERYALKFFVFENVMGLMNSKHTTRFQSICSAFRRAGFNLFHHDLDAQDFGVPQVRRRLFLVGLNKVLLPGAKFVFPAGHVRKATVREAIAGLPAPVFFERGLKATDIAYHPNHWTMKPKSAKFTTGTVTDGRSFRQLRWDEVSPTVAYGNREIHIHPEGGRRLSVHEAMLLQGFPSTYRLTGNFSEQITQVSNAVPPPMARVLARAVRRALEKQGPS